jgi:hypothetical protein
MLSIDLAATGLIHPVPVVGTTTRSLRSNAPVRISSLTMTLALAWSVSAVSRPA